MVEIKVPGSSAIPGEVAELAERLNKRAEEDEACADNSRVVADLLSPELARFNDRDEAGWNTYTVRMAADHRHSMERDRRYATDLRSAATALISLAARIEALEAGLERIIAAPLIDHTNRDNNPASIARLLLKKDSKA